MKPFLFIFLFSNVRAHGIWHVMCFTDIVVQMISSLSFKQENTIADQPVVDVLKYLNTKLDEAVARARLPSGWNPLQQLILIIGDGRFHERVIFFFSSPFPSGQRAVIAACLRFHFFLNKINFAGELEAVC